MCFSRDWFCINYILECYRQNRWLNLNIWSVKNIDWLSALLTRLPQFVRSSWPTIQDLINLMYIFGIYIKTFRNIIGNIWMALWVSATPLKQPQTDSKTDRFLAIRCNIILVRSAARMVSVLIVWLRYIFWRNKLFKIAFLVQYFLSSLAMLQYEILRKRLKLHHQMCFHPPVVKLIR